MQQKTACVAAVLSVLLGATALGAERNIVQLAQSEQKSAPPAAAPEPAAKSTPADGNASPAPAGPSTTAAARAVGLAAWNLLIGNSITGDEGGKTLTEFYAADGTAKSMTGNEISRGTWALAGEVVCFKYTDEPKPECYRIEVQGDSATYYDEKGSGTRYKILKGNPSNL